MMSWQADHDDDDSEDPRHDYDMTNKKNMQLWQILWQLRSTIRIEINLGPKLDMFCVKASYQRWGRSFMTMMMMIVKYAD